MKHMHTYLIQNFMITKEEGYFYNSPEVTDKYHVIIKNCSFQRNENEIGSGIIIQTDAALCGVIRCAATRHTSKTIQRENSIYNLRCTQCCCCGWNQVLLKSSTAHLK